MAEKVNKTPLLKDGEYTVVEVKSLAFFDLQGDKAKTKGTSNKTYNAELQVSKTDNRCQIFSLWGPTGAPNLTKDWRYYDDRQTAEKQFNSIIKSKLKKGYREIDVAQRAFGSDEAKAIVKPVTFNNLDTLPTPVKSNLHPITQKLIENVFGATATWVTTTLKCPLGQLTNAQIDRGRVALNKAKDILNNNTSLGKKQLTELQDLTNEFYGEIPHNLGQGARGQMIHLLFDDLNKVVQKESDLDTLLDAKSVGAVLNTTSAVDSKYQELNAELTFIDHSDPIYKFISHYFQGSKVHGHGFHSEKVVNIWKLDRKDKESEFFLSNSEKIAKECGKHVYVKETRNLCSEVDSWIPQKRPDLDSKLTDLFNKANTWLCWHGTRSCNVVGITKRGLLIRPAGAVHTGSLMGDGKYMAWQSTKSLNYCDGGYWTGRDRSIASRYMFLLDASFGNMHIAPRSYFYRSPPKGFHSVYGKANVSGLMNDEMITYDFEQKDTQSRIRYLLEIK